MLIHSKCTRNHVITYTYYASVLREKIRARASLTKIPVNYTFELVE